MSTVTVQNADCVISWVSMSEFSGAALDFSNVTLAQARELLKKLDIAYPSWEDLCRLPDTIYLVIFRCVKSRKILTGKTDLALYIPYDSYDDYLKEMNEIKAMIETRLGFSVVYASA